MRALPSGKSKTSLSGTRRIRGISRSYQNAHPGETVATNASPVKRILEAIRKLHEADGQKIDTGSLHFDVVKDADAAQTAASCDGDRDVVGR